MSQNESVLYPSDPNEAMPSEEELVRRLLQGGFMIQPDSSQRGFELSKAFMTSSELEAYETNGPSTGTNGSYQLTMSRLRKASRETQAATAP